MKRIIHVVMIVVVLFAVFAMPAIAEEKFPLDCTKSYVAPFEVQHKDGTWSMYIYSNLDCQYLHVSAGMSNIGREEASAMLQDFNIVLYDMYQEVLCARGDESFC